jgi:hypothetical protein
MKGPDRRSRDRDFVALEASDQKWWWRDIRDTSNQAMAQYAGHRQFETRQAPRVPKRSCMTASAGRQGRRQAGSGREARSLSSDPDRPCGGPRACYPVRDLRGLRGSQDLEDAAGRGWQRGGFTMRPPQTAPRALTSW